MIKAGYITLNTKGNGQVIDISSQTRRIIGESGIREGIICLFVTGATAAITTIEYEEGLLEDFSAMWERLIPEDVNYRHNLRWQDQNSHSHMRASVLGPSITIPIINGQMALGTWQQIVFVDFDNHPRERKISVQLIGE